MKKLRFFKRLITIICILLILGYFSTAIVKQRILLNSIKTQQVEVLKQINQVKKENERLKRLAEYVKSGDYIQKLAREKLNLAKKNDVIFIDKERKRKD
ncbi:septum formation initiator family protein [Caldicellulosiruptoraceae bacterium PP1]